MTVKIKEYSRAIKKLTDTEYLETQALIKVYGGCYSDLFNGRFAAAEADRDIGKNRLIASWRITGYRDISASTDDLRTEN